MQDYQEFLKSKDKSFDSVGFNANSINESAFPFQNAIIEWALKKGRAAIFADCGLGKTLMQLEWANQVVIHTGGDVLIVAPLAVSSQTIREAEKFGIIVTQSRDGSIKSKITVTNYEMLDKFDVSKFIGVVIDESSILKNFNGKTRNQIIDSFSKTPYRLACTATPSPNDYTELGNHAEFLGIMSRVEMLATFFFHDAGDTGTWTLKGHAVDSFWKWVCSWAVTIRKPSDIGFDDVGYILPELRMHEHKVDGDPFDVFSPVARGLSEQRDAKRSTIDLRIVEVAKLCNQSDEQWIVWCDLNNEGDLLEKSIPDSVQVSGSDSIEEKESKLAGFANGTHRVLITKAKIAGFGLNWQHCRNIVFASPTNSYEMFYQAIRRNWRFGQVNEVNCHIVSSHKDGAVVANLQRKERDALAMQDGMVKYMSVYQDIFKTEKEVDVYKESDVIGNNWKMLQGDCVERIMDLADSSIDYSIFSPPFASLYTYSNSSRDMGNCSSDSQFYDHFKFLAKELFRVTKSGRLLSFHCMNIPTSKERDGFIGIKDFRGDLIRIMTDSGWVYHSEVCIWKDPVTAMQRTKALGLLHKQVMKDSCMSRQGLADYVVTMRKNGTNENPVAGKFDQFIGDASLPQSDDDTRNSIEIWQRYASPVWMDINPSRTLQKESAREEKDERHICPLQLDVIDRCLQLWTNPGDIVLSPFAGIGSEGFESVKMGRSFIGIELKDSYFKQACLNLKNAESVKETKNVLDI